MAQTRRYTFIIPGVFGLIFVLILTIGIEWNNILVHVYRNVGSYQVIGRLLPYSNECQINLPELPDRYLKLAYEISSGKTDNWNVLVLVNGFQDRRWLSRQFALKDLTPPGDHYSKAIWDDESKKYFTVPFGSWTCERNLLSWNAWNYGLVAASEGSWAESAASYQAGIGLAPGRVPEEIVNEYYFSLSNFLLSQDDYSEQTLLPTAKYIALSGDLQAALRLLEEFAQTVNAGSAEFDEYRLWHSWIMAALNGNRSSLDIEQYLAGADNIDRQLSNAESPEWEITQTVPPLQPSDEEYQLIGFDLDQDILSAGAEVLGVLYWRTPDERVIMTPFRQPNLWTNSGSAWLLHDYWNCLPGYTEPDWIIGCASQMKTLPDDEEDQIYVSSLVNPIENAPDYYVETTSSAIEPGTSYVYGGEWWLDGNFSNPYIARRPLAVQDTGSYEVVLDLGSLPQRTWQRAVSLVSPTDSSSESVIWVRPKSGKGTGELRFQNAFSFKLPNP